MKYRVEKYESMVGLFSSVKDAAVEQRLDQRSWGLFIELIQIVAVLFEEIDEKELLEKIFKNEKVSQMVDRIIGGGVGQIEKAA